ncbi:MAG: helix-turn-helix domain-containing protein [Proteobacteria bacterium]|nr:helix-turn-helix domain-containing protein [Pseudomonadota bacterium]
MHAHTFSTAPLPIAHQLDAWRAWYDTVFDVAPMREPQTPFVATNATWTLPGVTLSRVSSPANTVSRSRSVIRRNGVDHWVVTLSRNTVTRLATLGTPLEIAPGTPFILSFGDESRIERESHDERLQLILARDNFQAIAPLLDGARGIALEPNGARLLADYMQMLDRQVPTLEPECASRLSGAVESMLRACLAPSIEASHAAREQVRVTLMERVRRAVTAHLRSPSLGPDTLCREAATSRSQLYRLLEPEGGVASYIQRRRLAEGFAMLSDIGCLLPIGRLAELLCFSDASAFSRAFRREFGLSPSDVRAMSLSGLPPALPVRPADEAAIRTFSDTLRS